MWTVWADTAYRSAANEAFLAGHGFAEQKARMGLFVRTIGIARATMKIGLVSLADNIRCRIILTRSCPA